METTEPAGELPDPSHTWMPGKRPWLPAEDGFLSHRAVSYGLVSVWTRTVGTLDFLMLLPMPTVLAMP